MTCPVGLYWAAACAAMRAGISRRQMLPYCDNAGRPIVGSYLRDLDRLWSAEQRWLFLLAHALRDAIQPQAAKVLCELPIIIAVPSVSGGHSPTSQWVADELSSRLGISISPQKVCTVTAGSYGGYVGLLKARDSLVRGDSETCIVAAADSWISARSLLTLAKENRLLTEENSDGVTPGEAAACFILTRSSERSLARIRGLGFAREPSGLSNEIPLRAEGLTAAVRAALSEAGMAMHQMDFRISDVSGESFYFKEQALMVARLLSRPKESFPTWACAESLGDTGAAAGLCGLAQAVAGFARGYAPGQYAIGCVGNEQGMRAALVLEAPMRQ
jgi:3-oxoacyl-[acyl-carrier-protein] synthase-1